jgi:hypothetical protein
MMSDQHSSIVAGVFQQLADEPVGNTLRRGKSHHRLTGHIRVVRWSKKNFHPRLRLVHFP